MAAKQFLAAAALLVGLVVGTPAWAKDHGRHHDRDDRWHHVSRRDHDRDDRWRRDHDRDDHWRRVAYREHDRDRRPPGWSHGKKKGWGNCDLPPGQAKKRGYDCDRDRDDWYRRQNRRRPIILGPTQRPSSTTSPVVQPVPRRRTPMGEIAERARQERRDQQRARTPIIVAPQQQNPR